MNSVFHSENYKIRVPLSAIVKTIINRTINLKYMTVKTCKNIYNIMRRQRRGRSSEITKLWTRNVVQLPDFSFLFTNLPSIRRSFQSFHPFRSPAPSPPLSSRCVIKSPTRRPPLSRHLSSSSRIVCFALHTQICMQSWLLRNPSWLFPSE